MPQLRARPLDMLHLQTKKGNEAKGPTGEEIKDLICSFSNKLAQPGVWPSTMCPPIYTLDNASIHHTAVDGWEEPDHWWQKEKIFGSPAFVPPHSPDLHQVPEHAHARIVHHFQHQLWLEAIAHKSVRQTVMGYWELVQQAFEATCTKEIISADVDRLYAVYEAVKSNNGDWAPRGLR